MKRMIRDAVPALHIVIELSKQAEAVVASDEFAELQHPSIRKKFKQSDEWLKYVNDLVRSILGSMQSRKFHIIKAYPSKKSYTYYIRFQPADEDGNIWEQDLELQIELRDHVTNDHDDIGEVTKNLLVKTYYIEDVEYETMMQLMRAIWSVLDSLQDGNFSSFFS